jgi:Ca2+-transporting ATPase
VRHPSEVARSALAPSTSVVRRPGVATGLGVAPIFTLVRGRIRVHVEGLRGRPTDARALEAWLREQPAVQHASASHLTGNVLVLFDGEQQSSRDALAMVRRARLDSVEPGRLKRPPGPGRPASRSVWSTMPASAVAARFEVPPAVGLSDRQAIARLTTAGANRVPTPRRKPTSTIVLDQLNSLPVYLLAGAAALSLVTGGLVDAIVIAAVVALNTAIGTVMESRAEGTIRALESLTVPQAIVRRDGKETIMPADRVVPGDVLVLKGGHAVPADGRLIEADHLVMNEASLTGESRGVAKVTSVISRRNGVGFTRPTMVYAGTVVAEGAGVAITTETGRQTELGRIRTLVGETESPPTPLERYLASMGRRLVGVALALSGVALAVGVFQGVAVLEMLRTAISLAVAVLPEGLPTVATTTLALGMQRLRQRRTIIRRLEVVESLGAVTVICVDKTGTLTENRMAVAEWHIGRRSISEGADRLAEVPRRGLEVCALCSEAELPGDSDAGRGSATELALLEAVSRHGLDYRECRRVHPQQSLRPRGDDRFWMGTVHETPGGHYVMAVKGAPEDVLRRCRRWLDDEHVRELTADVRRDIRHANDDMADRGMRILGLAFDTSDRPASSFEDLIWLGLVGLTDPVRPGIGPAIRACHRAGIRVIMLTGDQPRTALAVSRELALVRNREPRVLDASMLPGAEERRMTRLVSHVDVFARVSPLHKYEIVRALQAAGEVVAMTGDGVNDAPALRAADIGIAMGGSGTAVARGLADAVLLDNDFASILAAIAQGRTIYTNTRKALRFLLSTNASEIVVTLAAMAVGVARPLSALQFLWINLLSDVLPALALAVEPAEGGVMRRQPRDPREAMLSPATLGRIATDAALLSTATLGAYATAVSRYGTGPRSSGVAFSALTCGQLLHTLACRSEQRSGFVGLGHNLPMLVAVGGGLALQTAVVATPLRKLLGMTALGVRDWAVVGAGALLPLAVSELSKALTPAGPTAVPHERPPR